MTNQERWDYYQSGALQRATAIELLDWAGYWAGAGLDPITDPLQKEQTKKAIELILNDLSGTLKVVSALAISDDAIKACSVDGVTEQIIKTVVVSIMSNKLCWVTGIESLPESEE